ncbi:ion channel [Fodinibius sediminis]|nr:ion channel [Fodinibius sediminis]
MIHELYLVAGIFTVLVTACDFFYTTVSFNGAGVLAKSISNGIASLFLWTNKKTSSRYLLKFSGVTHILAQVALWISLLWFGLFLIMMSDPYSVLLAPGGEPASAINKLYFSGYVLSTLGNGQYIPNDGGWQIMVAAFSFAGFIFITTAMTYLMNLTSAVIHKRKLSLFISNLGETPEEILANSYTGNGFDRLTSVAPNLQQMINEHSQNHYAHPGVHYFYSIPRSESLSLNLTNLDEALSLAQTHIKMDTPFDQDLRPLRDTIDKFLNTVQHHFIKKAEAEADAGPGIQYLQKTGIPLVKQPREQPGGHERRVLLGGLLQSSGWNWNNIYNPDGN